MATVIENKSRAIRVRLLLWGSYLVAGGATFLAYHVFMTYGLSPGDGGVLKPPGERIALASIVLLFGLGTVVGMVLYARVYVLRLSLEGRDLQIVTFDSFGIRTKSNDLSSANVESATYYHGRYTAHRPMEGSARLLNTSVDAPWITLKFYDQTLPFVLDLQAERIDKRQLARLTPKAVADWRRDRQHVFMDQ